MNLGDPDLELIDPTPNVYALFLNFDSTFFWTKLASRAVVSWSKRMYSCAGVCSYEGRGGLCKITLSEPLLKLRPRKDLIETLLHEMIHAYLFITNNDRDRDGHGPNFQSHMHRINKSAGLHISIYHDFHDEVKLYQVHWWRCNGTCQTRKPYFGIVRRPMNRAPGPSDFWWQSHQRSCGGTFIKIKEPEKQAKKSKSKASTNADITKYINSNNNKSIINNLPKPVYKGQSNLPKNSVTTKSNSASTLVTKKGVVYNPTCDKACKTPTPVFNGTGHTIGKRKSTSDIVETVRNIWANKQLPNTTINSTNHKKPTTVNSHISKNKIEINNGFSPPTKIKKIDDYFKTEANTVLKDIYGQDIKLAQDDKQKFIATVHCPICNAKVNSNIINNHVDECLNRDVIQKLSQENADRLVPTPILAKDEIFLTGSIPHQVVYNNRVVEVNNRLVQEIDQQKHNIMDTIDLTAIAYVKYPSFRDDQQKNNSIFNENGEIKSVFPMDTSKNELPKCNKVLISVKQVKILDDIEYKSDKICREAASDVKKKETANDNEHILTLDKQTCPCCGNKFSKSVEEHLDECLVFFNNNATVPHEGASTSGNNVIMLDDDDFDETMTLNATGTKSPCPCCLKMIEMAQMNNHLEVCLT